MLHLLAQMESLSLLVLVMAAQVQGRVRLLAFAEIFCGDEKNGARVSALGEKGELPLLV